MSATPSSLAYSGGKTNARCHGGTVGILHAPGLRYQTFVPDTGVVRPAAALSSSAPRTRPPSLTAIAWPPATQHIAKLSSQLPAMAAASPQNIHPSPPASRAPL